MASSLHRAKTEPPPPITVEDTATGEPPIPSPSPTIQGTPSQLREPCTKC